MFVLIDNYDSFTYNLVHYIGELGKEVQVIRNDVISAKEVLLLSPEALVISPGPGIPDNSGICIDLVQEAAKNQIPIFGVCLGHQIIGQVFGANIIRAPRPIHGMVDKILHEEMNLFNNIPSPLSATRYHSLVIDPNSLPESIVVNAKTEDNLIMGISHKELPIHGVQFHPESIATVEGYKLIANFIEIATGKPVDTNILNNLLKKQVPHG
ncbi:MAG: aminodeoxychorismate/anthranilate synthase component II [Alphaproteobacteria bacterium]|jgi:anthranilate synthase component 2|nr:aminodeoxychorismate/anthranilate synthase component II [Alphaproteobacteria bacterium]PPR12684.1 MAG: Anthranilate synthase component 2 [Alphaproteobacteria bacterium MarineAlpha12_Bin1]|tara:strand:+ start:38860 stop:39492 length:633 start_codon:yes stop_codon:yes gene_type:complete